MSGPYPQETTPNGSGTLGQPSEVSSSADNGPLWKRIAKRAVYTVTRIVNASKKLIKKIRGALADRGATGGIAGWDMSMVNGSEQFIDLTGLQEHIVRQLRLVHAAFVCESHLGPTICHVPQQAHMPDNKSILSTIQMEAYGCIIQDKPKKVSGEQPYVQSPDGYRFPLKIRQGLPYMDIRPVRDDEWERLPSTWLCSDNEWDPSIYDHEVDHDWEDKARDSVEKRLAKLSHDEHGVLDVETQTLATEEETEIESVSRREVEINFTKLIEDELVDTVLEYEVDNEVYHRYSDSDDDSNEWEVHKVRRSSRLAGQVKDYSEAKRKERGKTESAPAEAMMESTKTSVPSGPEPQAQQ